jgi:integrase
VSEYRLVRHRGQFSIAWTDPERGRIRVATGQNERGAAEAVASRIWRERSRPVSERVADLWPPYAADRATTALAKTRMASVWKNLEPHFGYKLGKAITKADCRTYTEARFRAGKSNSTVKTELEALRACLRWHYGKEAPQITAPGPSKPRDRYLTKEQRDRFLESIDTPHVKLFAILAFTTGARMGAILDLTWDRVDLDAGTADFEPAGRDKTNKRRTLVKLNPRAIAELKTAYEGRLSDYVVEYAGGPVKSVKKAIAAASRRSGIKCSPHDFRRSAARWMAEADVSLDKIAQFLGHTTTRVTYATYARFSPRFMEDAAAALDW